MQLGFEFLDLGILLLAALLHSLVKLVVDEGLLLDHLVHLLQDAAHHDLDGRLHLLVQDFVDLVERKKLLLIVLEDGTFCTKRSAISIRLSSVHVLIVGSVSLQVRLVIVDGRLVNDQSGSALLPIHQVGRSGLLFAYGCSFLALMHGTAD